jgi:endonuclease YncB( thermonuclease family)
VWTSSVKNTAPSSRFFRVAYTKALRKGAFVLFGTCLFWHANLFAANNDCGLDRADEKAKVLRVYDGDTIELADGRKIRFIAVNTPELARPLDNQRGEPLSDEAFAAVSKLLPKHTTVQLKFETKKTDRYDRLLAHVFTENGVNVESELLKSGLAAHIAFPPNLWQAECYARLQASALKARQGIWGHVRFQPTELNRLSADSRGFFRVTVNVATILSVDKDVFILDSNGLGFRIDQEDLTYFQNVDFGQWRNRAIIGQGWIYRAKNGLMMRIRHPLMLEVPIGATNNRYNR